jgi:proteasome lid subunit RPN8/RPN11
MAKPKKSNQVNLRMSAEVAREIRQHARGNSKTEVCGVLVGADADGITSIQACIAGENAAQGGAHVTFTQDTWEHIYKIKDRDFPDHRIVGWYHSHPGFGVFLSDHDTFIHQNFFSSPNQVAWVYDPHSDEEGCFGWQGSRLERLERFTLVDSRGGEIAGESGKTEPRLAKSDDNEEWEQPAFSSRAEPEKPTKDEELSRLAHTVSVVFSHLAIFVLGGLLVWYLMPRVLVPVPIDPNTGEPIQSLQEYLNKYGTKAPSQNQPNTDHAKDGVNPNDSNSKPRGDGHQ